MENLKVDNYLPILIQIMKNGLIFSVENKAILVILGPQKRLISASRCNALKTGVK